jgi:hypothetical protein
MRKYINLYLLPSASCLLNLLTKNLSCQTEVIGRKLNVDEGYHCRFLEIFDQDHRKLYYIGYLAALQRFIADNSK